MEKRGQMKLSFGMIFSIILIIVFLFVAFYGIQKFLDLQKNIVYKQFLEDLNADVYEKWKSTQGSEAITYRVPSSVESICFIQHPEYELEVNLKKKTFPNTENIEHVDIPGTLGGNSKLCIPAQDSKIKLILQKDYSAPLVKVVRVNE